MFTGRPIIKCLSNIYMSPVSCTTVIILTGLQFLYTHTHTHPFNGPFSGTTQVSRYQKGKTNLDFTGARQWVAVEPTGPYASLHLAPDRQPRQHPTIQFFTGRMPFLQPNQQCQSTEGISFFFCSFFTLNTFSLLTWPKPWKVDWRLFNAYNKKAK